MTNNKQQTAVDILCGKLAMKLGIPQAITFYIDHAEEIAEAKAMHKEEQSKFTIDYFNWLHNNQYKYNPKVKMYQKIMINETLFFTIEELMIEFNKTQGGNNEQQ